MDAPDEGEEFDDDDIYDEEFDDEDLKEFQEDLQQAQEELQQAYEKFPGLLKKINKVYDELVRTADAKEILEKSAIGNAYKVIKGKVQNEYTLFDDALQEEEYNRLKVMLMEGEDPELVEKKIKKAIVKYPHKPAFYDMLIPVCHFSKQYDKQNELVLETCKLFPDVLFPKIGYATILLDEGKAGEALEVFNGKTDLNYLYPERKTFYISEAADYYACMCRTFTALGDIDSADLYMDAIFKKELTAIPRNTLVTAAIRELINAKIKKIDELNIN